MEEKKEEIIYGAKAAAKYLGMNRRTVHRLILQGIFPKHIEEIPVGEDREMSIKVWKKIDLDGYKPQIRTKGRPKATMSK